MNRRQLLTGFIATAGGLLMPEPRRVYSFLWNRETEHERVTRLAAEEISRAILRKEFAQPSPRWRTEITNRGSALTDRRIDVRITVQPATWAEANRLLAAGFEPT